MNKSKKTEMIESKVGSTLTKTKKGMKKVINGKTYNTETSKKVCSYVVNDWTHELYQSKTGEYFTYIYDERFLMSLDTEEKYSHLSDYGQRISPVSKNEVSHMMERSGLVSRDKGVTVLNELKDWCDEENEKLKVTGEGGLVNFDFGSWEVTLDIDDVNWVKMTPKGKSVFYEDDLDMIHWLRSNNWNKTSWEKVREEYLNERFGEC